MSCRNTPVQGTGRDRGCGLAWQGVRRCLGEELCRRAWPAELCMHEELAAHTSCRAKVRPAQCSTPVLAMALMVRSKGLNQPPLPEGSPAENAPLNSMRPAACSAQNASVRTKRLRKKQRPSRMAHEQTCMQGHFGRREESLLPSLHPKPQYLGAGKRACERPGAACGPSRNCPTRAEQRVRTMPSPSKGWLTDALPMSNRPGPFRSSVPSSSSGIRPVVQVRHQALFCPPQVC